MKKTTATPKLSLNRESLRVLSDKALNRIEGGGMTTRDVCSTESNGKCISFTRCCYNM